MASLRLQNVAKSFGGIQVIKDVDLDLPDGEFVVFVGPSGCGKSTLLRIISGLEEISSGRIFIDDEDISIEDPSKRGVSMVFQSYALYPHMNVRKNMGFGLRMGGMPKKEVDSRVNEAARILDIGNLMNRKPKALSGGQRQRVAIGRAIVRQPKVFLFDEPLSNLDAELRTQTRLEISRLHQELKTTMIFVTHDQVEAMTLADRIVVLRDGRVEQQGKPIDIYDDPDNQFVAGFIGSPKMNFMSATVIDGVDNTITIRVNDFTHHEFSVEVRHPGKLSKGDDVVLGIRPEHLSVPLPDAEELTFTARVQAVERLGGVSYLYCIGKQGGQICVQENGHSMSAPGEDLTIGVDKSRCFLFGTLGDRK